MLFIFSFYLIFYCINFYYEHLEYKKICKNPNSMLCKDYNIITYCKYYKNCKICDDFLQYYNNLDITCYEENKCKTFTEEQRKAISERMKGNKNGKRKDK